jgi:hypothetical protein
MFDSSNVARIGQVQITIGVGFGIEFRKRAGVLHLSNELLVFFIAAATPDNLVRLCAICDLVHPLCQGRKAC